VLLYWTGTAGSFPISTYEIRKGATWAGGTLIGTKSGGFTTVFEALAGTYTYWVAPLDAAGNYGTPASITTKVNQPPDYVLKADILSAFAGTLSSALKLANGNVLLPVDTVSNVTSHFTVGHTWNTIQDQITAGYPLVIEPAVSSGYYEETIDYGAVLPATYVTVNVTGSALAGAPVVSVQISTSPDNSTWTVTAGNNAFGTGFRYVKVRVTVTSAGTDLYLLTALETRLDSKLKNDGGTVAAVSTDTLGTIVNFSTQFVDVSSAVVSPMGTTVADAIADFHDAVDAVTYTVASNVCTVTHTAHPWVTGQKLLVTFLTGTGITGVYTITGTTANTYTFAMTTANQASAANAQTYPQSMRVYLFNSAGTRISGNVAWTLKGY